MPGKPAHYSAICERLDDDIDESRAACRKPRYCVHMLLFQLYETAERGEDLSCYGHVLICSIRAFRHYRHPFADEARCVRHRSQNRAAVTYYPFDEGGADTGGNRDNER